MSHIVTIKTRVTDAAALCAACRRLALPALLPEGLLYSMNTTDWMPEISKRLRQRGFLQAVMSSRRSM